MGEAKDRLLAVAAAEWDFFQRTERRLDDSWTLGGNGSDDPYRARVADYWASVGLPDWDGATDEPWSAAFISWCFAQTDTEFAGDATHSVYIDAIRRQDGMSPLLTLHDTTRPLALGDLIWNSRGENNPPQSHAAAVAELKAGNFFDSHVDIVVAVGPGACESIGGNVWNVKVGGSVARSHWRLDNQGRLDDPRKTWIGVVSNAL